MVYGQTAKYFQLYRTGYVYILTHQYYIDLNLVNILVIDILLIELDLNIILPVRFDVFNCLLWCVMLYAIWLLIFDKV